jgi:hypothetical protein
VWQRVIGRLERTLKQVSPQTAWRASLVASVALVVIFTASLAHAKAAPDAKLILVKNDSNGDLATTPKSRRTTEDSITDNEDAIFSAPLSAPMYHDRYRFYHRYDLYRAPSRAEPLDDGID